MTEIDVIAFDADDTLWHNETQYTYGKERFGQLLASYQDPEKIMRRLDVIEMENVQTYGYGIKSFSLSMVEAAVGITNGQVQGDEIQAIIDLSKDLLEMQMVLFDQVEETLAVLSAEYDLLMITKGDTFEQERKIERTGLAGYFKHIEIVADKTAAVYRGVLRKYAVEPTHFLMVGNSLRSDVLPVIEIGGQAVYIPYEHTWVHENMVDQPVDEESYHEIEQLGQLPKLIKALID